MSISDPSAYQRDYGLESRNAVAGVEAAGWAFCVAVATVKRWREGGSYMSDEGRG